MATTYTTNYNLGKQENHADKFDMDVITDNADKIDAALTELQSGIDGKQATLTPEQLEAVNSGITDTDVAQITTNKNNILSTCCVGTCTTAGNVAAKIVNIDDANWTLRKGCIIGVKFTYSNNSSTDNVTLNVNNTGDKGIYFNNNVYADHATKVCGAANTYIYYMYDGTYWSWINFGFDSTYSNMTQSEATTGTATTGHLISAKVLSDTIDEKIQPLENNILSLSPTDYQTPTVSSNITLRSGGIYKIGQSVTLCVRINVGAALAYGDTIFTGLPLPVSNTSLAANTNVVYAANGSGVNIGITREGNLVAYEAIPVSAITINCTYLATQ